MEEIYLRELSLTDGEKELKFLRDFPTEENGFQNPCKEEFLSDITSFKKWLENRTNISKGIDLPEGRVPETIYWIMKDDNIVGIGRLRHYLNEKLLQHGGNIGYGISTLYRGMGIGKKALSLLIEESKKYDLDKVLLTVDEGNMASRKIIESNFGVLDRIDDGCCYYWINTKKIQPKTV